MLDKKRKKIMFLAFGGLCFLIHCSTTTIHTTMRSNERGEEKKQEEDPKDEAKPLEGEMLTRGAAVPELKCPCKEELTGAASSDNGDDQPFDELGLASWYGRDFDGKPTASGEIFDSRKLTGAHKKIPLGSIVLVRNMENDKEVFLKINDRGPFIDGRILDVSEYGAEVLGYKEEGLTQVGIRIVRKGEKADRSEGKGATADYFNAEHKEFEPRALDREAVKTDQGQDHYSVQVGVFADLRHARKARALSGRLQPSSASGPPGQ